MADLLMKMPLPYEPKKKNRWLITFPADLGIQQWWLSSASRPSITQNEVEIPFLNTSTWVIGRFTWEAIDVTFRDPIGPSASQAIMEWVRNQLQAVKVTLLVTNAQWNLKCLTHQGLLLKNGYWTVRCLPT